MFARTTILAKHSVPADCGWVGLVHRFGPQLPDGFARHGRPMAPIPPAGHRPEAPPAPRTDPPPPPAPVFPIPQRGCVCPRPPAGGETGRGPPSGAWHARCTCPGHLLNDSLLCAGGLAFRSGCFSVTPSDMLHEHGLPVGQLAPIIFVSNAFRIS